MDSFLLRNLSGSKFEDRTELLVLLLPRIGRDRCRNRELDAMLRNLMSIQYFARSSLNHFFFFEMYLTGNTH